MPTINLGRVVGTDGTNGTDGKSAYAAAVEGGYTGTEAEFYAALADIATKPEAQGYAKTAEENATHRNTVNYRIHKIAEMLGIDIQDGQTRYKIQTALYIRKLLKRTECTQEQRL